MRKFGRLIVIDGSDGSGKQTQTSLLVEKMREEGLKGTPFLGLSFQYTHHSTLPGEGSWRHL